MDKLKPCPFCGSKDIEILEWPFEEDEHSWQVECQGCAASGSMYLSKTEAIEEWNRRGGND